MPINDHPHTRAARNAKALIGHRQIDEHERDEQAERAHAEPQTLATLPHKLALAQLVEADAEYAGQDFELGVLTPVLAFAYVGRNRLGAFVRQLAVRADAKTQSRREAFEQPQLRLVARVRL